MILIIDNKDSFVYNLVHYIEEMGLSTHVVRNDAISLDEIEQLAPSHCILSPGPCTPNEAGICLSLVQHFYQRLPILGVCLGHQAIAQAFGAQVCHALKPLHGRSALITHSKQGLFENLPSPLKVGRYHSLIVSKTAFPQELLITAESEEMEIMALAHRQYPVFGVQFHPESILTEAGKTLLRNFFYDHLASI